METEYDWKFPHGSDYRCWEYKVFLAPFINMDLF